jgi:hypothetical protein
MTTRAEGMARLLQLAEMLDRADEEHKRKGEPGYDQERYRHGCGAPACGLGHWAAANPDRWKLDVDTYAPALKHGLTFIFGLRAAEHDFALTSRETLELFEVYGCNNAKTALEAAAYIRAFVARQGQP